MLKTTAMGLVTGLAVLSAAPSFAEITVREVDVTVDMEAIQNEKAAAHWATLADDLENAIVANLVGKTDDKGSKITVDLNELELANSYQAATGIAESRMVGDVIITHDSDNSKFDNYELSVTFADAGPFFAPGTDLTKITSDSKEYYDAMISAFADHIVKKLD